MVMSKPTNATYYSFIEERMLNNYIIGELVIADISNRDEESDIEGMIIILSDQTKQKIYFNISIPVGLMQIIMPQYWSEYVLVEVCNTTDMYLFKSIDFAEEEYLSGIYDKEQLLKIQNAGIS